MDSGESKKPRKTREDPAPKPVKTSGEELSRLEEELTQDNRSVMFQPICSGADHSDLHRFYGKMVLKCRECADSFDHEDEIRSIEREITCPGCGKKHLMKLKPSSTLYSVHCEGLDVVEDDRRPY